MLKLLIIGAGGIGGYYAAKLSAAGHQLVLTARGKHLAAMQASGLEVHSQDQRFHCQVPAYDHGELVRRYQPDDFDLIMVCLKSTATLPLLDELGDWLMQGTVPVLSLQNGVDNEPLFANALGESRVLGGLAVRIGGHIIKPGVVSAQGEARIVMGIWPTAGEQADPRHRLLDQLKAAFEDAGIPVNVSEAIRYELWRKLVINNGVNPLSALTGLDTGTLTHDPQLKRIVYGMMAETVEASKADGVNLSQQDLDDMFQLISEFDPIKTSMLVDKEKGRPLELDSIAGAVIRRCQQQGREAPFTETVVALLAHAN